MPVDFIAMVTLEEEDQAEVPLVVNPTTEIEKPGGRDSPLPSDSVTHAFKGWLDRSQMVGDGFPGLLSNVPIASSSCFEVAPVNVTSSIIRTV